MLSYHGKDLTILVCCYNGEKFLDKCLDSLVKQKRASLFYKILFVNDASTDDSFKIAESYRKSVKNLMILNNKKNIGLVKCCNNTLDAIQTKYFMRLDADDYLSVDALENISRELNSSDERGFTVFQRWDVDDNKIQDIKVTDDIYTWIAGGTVFAKAAVESVGCYSREYWEEYDLYIRLLEKGFKHKISSQRIYYYRRGHNSMTKDYQKNKHGLESLSNKWGIERLKKYGNFNNFLKYYLI